MPPKPHREFLLFWICVALRLISLHVPILDDDEAWFSASARGIHSPFELYLKAPDNKPPGTAWFYWFFHGNPIAARAGMIVLIVATAYFLGRLARRISANAQWPTSLLFLLATVIPAPKLLAVTNEGLMLAPLCLSMGIWWIALQNERAPRPILGALSGVLLTAAILVKQTALVFLIPPSFALLCLSQKQKPISASGVITSGIAFVLGLTIPITTAIVLLHPAQVLFWNFTYATSVLASARESVFSEGMELIASVVILGVGLAPLVSASLHTLRDKEKLESLSKDARRFLLLWFASAGVAVLAGWGIFLHYFLLLLPPLCLWAGLSIGKRGLTYLTTLYAACCLFLLIPFVTALWGTDLFYYSQVANRIEALTQPDENVFLWGGNAMPLPLSKRSYATRFVTSRFAAPPYTTPELAKVFEQEFSATPPQVFVDLHERGDNRFRLPVDIYPWLKRELITHYQEIDDPSLPWATVYLHLSGDKNIFGARMGSMNTGGAILRAQLLERDAQRLRGDFMHIFFSMDTRAYFRLFKWLSTSGSWKDLAKWDKLLRAWLSFPGAFMSTEPIKSSIDRAVEELDHFWELLFFSDQATGDLHWKSPFDVGGGENADIAEETATAFKRRGQEVPLALQSRAWWISFATVKLQPAGDSQ